VSEEKYLEDYLLIKKTTEYVRQKSFPSFKELEDDVSQEAFIKLFKNGFFVRDDHKGKSSYISRAVSNCFIDQLKSLGIICNLTKAEKTQSNNKYLNIVNIGLDDMLDNNIPEAETITPENQVNASDAYKWIKNCFESVFNDISDPKRQAFFESAFWWYNDQGVSTKELALLVGYKSSNPTQELKRLIQKVSLCTQPHGIEVVNPNEQVQFLQEQIQSDGSL